MPTLNLIEEEGVATQQMAVKCGGLLQTRAGPVPGLRMAGRKSPADQWETGGGNSYTRKPFLPGFRQAKAAAE